ncbi:MAG: HD domain-containing phosphohydrolase [Pseudomonadota bacterium]
MRTGTILPEKGNTPKISSSRLALQGSSRRLLKKNIPLFSVCVLLVAVFCGVLWLAVDQIYKKEASKQHELTLARMGNAQAKLQSLFAGFSDDLKFVASLKPFCLMTENWRVVSKEIDQASDILQNFLSSYAIYKAAMVVGPESKVLIRIARDPTDHQSAGSARFSQSHQQAVGPSTPPTIPENARESSTTAGVGSATSLEGNGKLILSTRLAGGRSNKGFRLVFLVDNLELVRLLPDHIFLIIDGSEVLGKTADGTLQRDLLSVDFTARSGWVELTPETTLHYRKVHVTPTQEVVIGAHHFYPQLKRILYWLFGGSLGLFFLFLVLILYLGYLNVSQYTKKLGAQRAMLFSLATLAEERDPETGAHLERTRSYALVLAKRLAVKPEFRPLITPDYLEDLYDSAPLHDIGKVAIPDSILLKPDALTPEEFDIMKSHVTFSRQVLENAALRYGLKEQMITIGINIATFHHERYDGKGYPDGLKGKEIPLEARIFALCDAYDAIRSDRPYKKGLPHAEAISRIKADRGKHFDPEIVDAFLEDEKEIIKIDKMLRPAA